ncbi:hypothetical protein [Halomonas cerina]|uniref:Nitrate reductase gamma subunit n=1 Tax=Halomonas cerina TaxID=447424 RepID=A0A839UZD5_9GAMM|nr:hypothetical protein [Halomonas cerina]MBB3188883.1 nitrate reductase gamma subunit [Halomonas cerina]
MNALLSFITHAGISAATLLPSGIILAHSGHGAPEMHAHAGSPSLMAVLAVVTLGMAALVPLARLVLRRRRLRHPR